MPSLVRRCVAELLGTFALVAIGPGAVMVAARTHAFGPSGVALAFGLAVTIIVAGGSFNPARSLGPAVASGMWTAHWLYWAAPTIGMVLAMRLYEHLKPASAKDASPKRPFGVEGPI
jgi:aquaporin Z